MPRIDLNQSRSREHGYIGDQGGSKPLASAYVGMLIKMKLTRIRYLLIVFAAIFVASNAVAAGSVDIVEQVAPYYTGTQSFEARGGQPCLDTDGIANCWEYCAQSYQSDEPTVSFNANPSITVPAPSPHRVGFRAEPRRFVIVSAPPVVGPSLTILFGNLRD